MSPIPTKKENIWQTESFLCIRHSILYYILASFSLQVCAISSDLLG